MVLKEINKKLNNMTVYELIEKLQSFNQDEEVIIYDKRWDENLDIIEVEYHDDKVAVVSE
nr:MAG: hypothetical protein [Bacteriophage sp.]